MESIKKQIELDLKEAMKAKNMASVSALRLIMSAIKNREIELRGSKSLEAGSGLADTEALKLLSTLAKQRKESIKAFSDGGRQDLRQKEEAELEIIQRYLPAQLSETELESIVEKAIQEVGAEGSQDMGKVMKAVMSQVAGQADGKLVNEMVRKKLQT